MKGLSRREWMRGALGVMAGAGLGRPPVASGAELSVPAGATDERFDFEAGGIERWTVVSGQWTVEDVEGAPSGKKVLVQRVPDPSGAGPDVIRLDLP